MTLMQRTFRLARVTKPDGVYTAHVTLELRDRDEGVALSITGSIARGSRIVCAGQVYDSLREYILPALRDDERARVERFVELWRRWHLNDMRPGCAHQMAAGWGKEKVVVSEHGTATLRDTTTLTPEEHTDGVLGVPCPVCGERFGYRWHFEALPDEVLVELFHYACEEQGGVEQ